jgi:hypothetical protein
MPGKSQKAHSFRVAKTQHTPPVPGGIATTRDVLAEIEDYIARSGFPSKAAALARAGVDGPDFYRALGSNIPLSAGDAGALAGIAETPDLQARWAQDLQRAFLRHRAAARGAPLHDLSLLALINGGATRHKRISTPKDYWLFLLFCVMQACGREPAAVTASNIDTFIDALVDAPRRMLGERVALTHALILTYACLYNLPEDKSSGVAMLTAVVVTIDLAAQFNDVFIESRMIAILERHVRPLLSGDAAFTVYDCAITACRSATIHHTKTFRPGSAAAVASHDFTVDALQSVKLARQHLGFAADHRRLRERLTMTAFQGVQTALSLGLPHAEVDEFIKLHDEIVPWFLPPDGSFEPLETPPRSGEADIYRLDMLAELALHRPDRPSTLSAPSARLWRFDPDQALAATSQAMAAVDSADNTANTAIANVYMLQAEALLCKHVRDATDRTRARRWTGSAQEEYVLARARAVAAFTDLNMAWKLRRLAGQELRAGIVAEEWGMEVFHRRSPNAAAAR